MDRLRERSESPLSVRSSVDDDMEMTGEAPLDLSVKSECRVRMYRDSFTDSDDSDGDKVNGGKAYKKNLMKRYCKYFAGSHTLLLPLLSLSNTFIFTCHF